MTNFKPGYPESSKAACATQSPNRIIAEIYSTGAVRDKEGKLTKSLVQSTIPHIQGAALYEWIRRTGLTRTLEIGMGYGLSTLFMCQAHVDNGEEGRHIAIDPGQNTTFESIGLLNIQRAKLGDRLEFFQAPSYEVLPTLLKRGERFDLIFIDGMHTFDYTLVDFFFADLLLNTGGHIVFDDIWMPSVRKVVMYVLRNRRYRLEPQFLKNQSPAWRRAWSFATHKGRKPLLKTNARQVIENPLDFLTFIYLGYFGLSGGLRFRGLQKTAEDDRQWDS